MTYLQRDPPPHLKGRAKDLFLVQEQRRWIESCERNGVSYAGERGPSIRKADQNALARLEARVRD